LGGKTKLIGFAVTFVFLGLILWKMNLTDFADALRSANYWYVVPAAICTLLSYVLRTVRWREILRPTKLIPVFRLFPVLMIGFMANNILPARLGEFVRAYTLGEKEQVSKSLGFATIMLERLLDGLTLLGFLLVLSRIVRMTTDEVSLSYVTSAIFAGATAFVVLLLVREELALRLLAFVLRPFPHRFARRAAEMAGYFILGLHALRNKWTVLALFGLSVVIWSVEAASYFLILRAFGVGSDVLGTLQPALLMLVFVNLFIMIPSAPGYVGLFEGATILALGTFGVPGNQAFAIGVVSHGIQWFLVTGLGFVFLMRENLSLSQLRGEGTAEAAVLEAQRREASGSPKGEMVGVEPND
jgi:glycosyltransferase 2 family protein